MANIAVVVPVHAAARRTAETIAARSPAGAVLGLIGLGLSVVLMSSLHIVASGQVNPISTTLSDYVYARGAEWMFGASVVCMAIGGAGAFAGLTRAHLLPGMPARVVLVTALVGLLLVALFPTDRGVAVVSLSAQIHRYSAAVVFVCVPIVGLLVAAHADRWTHLAACGRWLRRSAFVTAAVLAVVLITSLRVMPDAVLEMRGLVQRVMFLLEVSVLAQLVYLPVRQVALSDG
ncbi:MAG: DUF998 domain-containing protein [Haloechinothrix sp.]